MARQLISDIILQLLRESHLLTAPQLVEKLHHQGNPVNKTTVYRALEKLEAQGVVCKHNLVNNDLAYELREHHHDHLICTQCGQVVTAECLLEVLPQVQDFNISHHHLTLYGVCSECQNHA